MTSSLRSTAFDDGDTNQSLKEELTQAILARNTALSQVSQLRSELTLLKNRCRMKEEKIKRLETRLGGIPLEAPQDLPSSELEVTREPICLEFDETFHLSDNLQADIVSQQQSRCSRSDDFLAPELQWLSQILHEVNSQDSALVLLVVDSSVNDAQAALTAANSGSWTRIDASEGTCICLDDVLDFGCFVDPENSNKRLISNNILAAINLSRNTKVKIELFHPLWFRRAIAAGPRWITWWRLLTSATHLAGWLNPDKQKTTPAIQEHLMALREDEVLLGPHFEARISIPEQRHQRMSRFKPYRQPMTPRGLRKILKCCDLPDGEKQSVFKALFLDT